jgi:hypothetical protein
LDPKLDASDLARTATGTQKTRKQGPSASRGDWIRTSDRPAPSPGANRFRTGDETWRRG